MDDQKKQYLMARISTETYQLNPEYLSAHQRAQVEEKVQNMSMIQALILSSCEAEAIEPVRAGELEKAFKECIDNYPSKADFKQALASQHLTVDGLRQSLRDQLMCDRILDEVVSDVPPLDIDKARQYYQKHRLEFSRATTWEMSQILITINDEYAENTRVNALKRIRNIYEKVLVKSFEQYAVRYSECPSAMNNGYLGWCEEGKLYPQITQALHRLKANEISLPIETDIGFHLVQYRQKKEAKVATFEEVWPFLQEKHNTRARNYLQKQWINQLINQSKHQRMKDKIVCD